MGVLWSWKVLLENPRGTHQHNIPFLDRVLHGVLSLHRKIVFFLDPKRRRMRSICIRQLYYRPYYYVRI